MVGKFESTKDDLEEKLGEWKADHGVVVMEIDEIEEVPEEPQKLSATEALKKRLKEEEARKELRQGGSRGGRMTMGSEVIQFHFIFSSTLFSSA